MKPKTTCPYCKENAASSESGVWPFCSTACQNKDLSGWVFEKYRVADHSLSTDEIPTSYDSSEEEV